MVGQGRRILFEPVMTQYKFYSGTDSQPNPNPNLLLGILPQERIITDIKEAYDYDGGLFIYEHTLFKTQLDQEVIKYRFENNKPTKILVDYAYETGLTEKDFNVKISQIVGLGIDAKDIIFVLNRSAYKEWLEKHIDQLHFIDIFAVSAVVRHMIHGMKISKTNIKDRPLLINLLLGKVNKQSRLRIIESFNRSNIKEKTKFSFLGLLDDKSNSSYDLVKNNQGPIDDAQKIKLDEEFSSQGWGSNSIIYDSTSVSFICETHETNDSLFITEKTYRPIINRHPFVARASFPILRYLKALGFKTFDRFIDETYDNVNSVDEQYADKLISNAEKLLAACESKPEQIQAIVDHNYQMLVNLAQSELAMLNNRLLDALK